MPAETVDGNSLAAVSLLAVILAFLAGAILAIRYAVRSSDVLHGGFIERGDDKDES